MTATIGDPALLLPGLPAAVRTRPRRRTLATVGPAALVAAGYVDPGNWGTDVAAGSAFGYRLVWVLAAATGAALVLQGLAARLGHASGRDLATLLRERTSRTARAGLVPPLLLALVVTEVVEVLGVVVGVRLLTGWSVPLAVLASTALVLATFVSPPGVARRTVYGCLALVGAVYLVVLITGGGLAGVAVHLHPETLPTGGLPVAVGLVGSVVMPHNILLHSALARDARAAEPTAAGDHGWERRSALTTAAALGLALAVNCAITSVAVGGTAVGGAAVGGSSGGDVATALGGAAPTFGAATTALFAVTLIGAGLASSVTGGMASADVVANLLPRLPGSVVSRRVACLAPAALVAGSGASPVAVLVWSQVVLTLALPLVLVPLVWFCSRRDVVGDRVLGLPARVGASALTAALLVAGVASLVVA